MAIALEQDERIYGIGDGMFKPTIWVRIKGVPPCFLCGVSVTALSFGGPLICGDCDCGYNQDGTKKTQEDHDKSSALFRSMVHKYHVDKDGNPAPWDEPPPVTVPEKT